MEIIKVLGTPSKQQIELMNPNYTEFKFPQIKSNPWNRVFKSRTPPDVIDLISKILVYDPARRLKPLEALLHPFFDELREKNTYLENGDNLPELFEFTREEVESTAPEIIEQLIPKWYRK